jgi:hypothetical protein
MPHSTQEAATVTSQTDGIANYIMQGLDVQTGTEATSSTDSALPVLTNPLPTGIPANATWSSFTYAADTHRPDKTIIWSSSMPKVEKCWSDIVKWRRSSVDWWNQNYRGRTVAGPVTTTTWFEYWNSTFKVTSYPSSVSAYTLCDGSPRVNVNPVTKTTVSTLSTYSYTRATIANQSSTFPIWEEPQPCDPDPETCRLWYYHSNIIDMNEDELLQQCGRPTNYNESCVIVGGPIELIYWPVPPKVELCENNATRVLGPTTFASNTSALSEVPETITTLGHTFTSGTVYLSFSTLYASWDGFWNHVGPNFTDLIVPLPSSSLFSQCGGARSARNHGTPLNYADLNWPVPASAYGCQARCDPVGEPICPGCEYTAVPTTGECGTIWSDINPNLAMPTEIRDLVPEWSTCLMYNDRIPNFWFDPPIALTKQTAIALPTLRVQPTTESAAPSSTFSSAVPAETGTDPAYPEITTAAKPSGDSIPETSIATNPTATSPASASTEAEDTGNQHEPSSTSEDPHSSQNSIPDKGADTSPATVFSGSSPTAVTGHEPPLFTYDPITSLADPETTVGDNTAVLDPTTSGSLNALSVLESAMSQLSTAEPTSDTHESIVINISSSEVVFFPLPTKTTGAQVSELPTHTGEDPDPTASSTGVLLSASGSDVVLSIGTNGVAVINSSHTSYVSLPEATISSLLSGGGQAYEPSTPSSLLEEPTSGTAPATEIDPNLPITSQTSYAGSSFSYSPLSPSLISTGAEDKPASPTQTLLAAGSLTTTADAVPTTLSSAALISGTTLSAGGPAITLPQSQVVSFAPDGTGLVVVHPSGGGSQVLSIISVTSSSHHKPHATETTSELPSVLVQQPGTGSSGGVSTTSTSEATTDLPQVVVQQPGPTGSSTSGSESEDSSSAASTATGTGTGDGEVEVDLPSDVGKPARQVSRVVFVMLAIVGLMA